MSIADESLASAPVDRARRLDEAGVAWGSRIDANRAAANLTYQVIGLGEGGVTSRITAGKHTFVVDEPSALAGDDAAASPVQFALCAQISCQVVVFHLYANALGIPFDEIEMTADGDFDAARLVGLGESVRAGLGEVWIADAVGPGGRGAVSGASCRGGCALPGSGLISNATPVTTSVRMA